MNTINKQINRDEYNKAQQRDKQSNYANYAIKPTQRMVAASQT